MGSDLVSCIATCYAATMTRPLRIELEGAVYPPQHEGTLSRRFFGMSITEYTFLTFGEDATHHRALSRI